MTGRIIDLSRERTPAALSADVCIVGSGSAGSTAARLLAEAGKEVVVLEEGRDMNGRFDQRESHMYDQIYMDRGGRMDEDMAINVLQARVLGGGGVVNAGDVVPIPEAVLHHWSRKYSLTELSPEALAPHRDAALEDLSARRITEDQMTQPNVLLRRGAEALGLRGELMMHNRSGCLGLGTCLIGCPIGAKRHPGLVSLPLAVAAGANVYTRARAVRIGGRVNATKIVAVRILDEKGYHEKGSLDVTASTVILAANAIASAQLLLRSGIGNQHVGRHLSLQPQLPIVARYDRDIDGYAGIPQSYAVTHFEQEDHPEHGLWGFRIEGIMGTPGLVASQLPFIGEEGKAMMTQYRRLAAALLLTPDEPTGEVGLLDDGRPSIRYEHAENHKTRLRRAVREASRIYFETGASEVMVPGAPPLRMRSMRDVEAVDSLRFLAATTPFVSAHQQGTTRFGHNAAAGAVDPSGEIYGTRGVFVFDSGVFPSSASSHTMTPIVTMARYLTTRLLAERS